MPAGSVYTREFSPPPGIRVAPMAGAASCADSVHLFHASKLLTAEALPHPTNQLMTISPEQAAEAGCDRYPPPRQRCGGFGEFVSDSGRDHRPDMELAAGLPPGAKAGDTIRARDTRSFTQVYPINDTSSWRLPAIVLSGFLAAFLLGLLILKPWLWRIRFTGRRANHPPTTHASPPP